MGGGIVRLWLDMLLSLGTYPEVTTQLGLRCKVKGHFLLEPFGTWTREKGLIRPAYSCIPSTWEAEAGGSRVQGQSGQRCEAYCMQVRAWEAGDTAVNRAPCSDLPSVTFSLRAADSQLRGNLGSLCLNGLQKLGAGGSHL
jgi:hypothetical protein